MGERYVIQLSGFPESININPEDSSLLAVYIMNLECKHGKGIEIKYNNNTLMILNKEGEIIEEINKKRFNEMLKNKNRFIEAINNISKELKSEKIEIKPYGKDKYIITKS